MANRKKKRLPQDIVAKWPEVFKDIDIDAIPLEYVESITVFFHNGKKWEIEIKDKSKKDPLKEVELALNEMFTNYNSAIKNVDFRVDSERVKNDVQKRTKQFLKKRK